MPKPYSTKVFSVKARRCKRCGGLLTGDEALKDGYGHTCKMRNTLDLFRVAPDSEVWSSETQMPLDENDAVDTSSGAKAVEWDSDTISELSGETQIKIK